MRFTMSAIAPLASACAGNACPASPARVSSGSIGMAPRYGTDQAAAISRAPLESEQNTCRRAGGMCVSGSGAVTTSTAAVPRCAHTAARRQEPVRAASSGAARILMPRTAPARTTARSACMTASVTSTFAAVRNCTLFSAIFSPGRTHGSVGTDACRVGRAARRRRSPLMFSTTPSTRSPTCARAAVH
jgi:hypothetical protein